MAEGLNNLLGGGAIRLAPDLAYPSSLANSTPYRTVSAVDCVGALTTVLSLTGKHSVSLMRVFNIAAEAITIKLTVDGVVIWNDSIGTANPIYYLHGGPGATANDPTFPFVCNSSLLLEVQTTADTSIDFTYIANKIL